MKNILQQRLDSLKKDKQDIRIDYNSMSSKQIFELEDYKTELNIRISEICILLDLSK